MAKLRNIWLPLLVLALLLSSGGGLRAQASDGADALSGQIRHLLTRDAKEALLEAGGRSVPLAAETVSFYQQRNFTAAWLTERGLLGQARRVLTVLQQSRQEGLRPEEYHLPALAIFAEQLAIFREQGRVPELLPLARFDVLLTDAFLRYAADMTEGRVQARKVYPQEWRVAPRAIDLVAALQLNLDYGRAAEALRDMVPDHADYRGLREQLAIYRGLAAAGGWPQLPAGPVLRVGDRDWRLPWLRQHLAQTGDLDAALAVADRRFDEAVSAAVERFQQRHGLQADGILGPETLAALNVSVEERIRQIEINMERWRWLPRELGWRHLAVNIADFSLEVVEEGLTVLAMPVIVGTGYRRTPVFSAQMRYLDFAPYWNVPMTILREDKLPLIKADLRYLANHHYEIVARRNDRVAPIAPEAIDWEVVTAETFPGLLRQKPGPWNPLGRVKFMFPNKFHVYLHDTPERHLFDRKRRSFSSGCIRIEKPFELALYLLQQQTGWDAARVEEAMAAEEPLRVLLEEPLPVHILYRTAWVDGEGCLQFRNDIYQRDAALYAALRRHNRQIVALVACRSGILQ